MTAMQWRAVGLIPLASIAVMWAFGIKGFGTAATAVKVVDMVGVWVFSWGLVAIATLAALALAWVAFSSAHEAREAETSPDPRRRAA